MRQILPGALVVFALTAGVWGAEEEILIRQGTPPALDGRVETAEWCDASGIRFCVGSSSEVRVLFKHDASYLYFAFLCGEPGEGAFLMPEVAVDTALDRGTAWAADDWWFHVSATDCEARGRFDVYTACALDHGDWSGVPNLAPVANPPPVDEFEIRIPLSKLGLSVGGSFGVFFCVLDPSERRASWPFGSTVDSPASWARATTEGTAP